MPVLQRVAAWMSPEEWRYVGAAFLGGLGLATWVAGFRRSGRGPSDARAAGDTCPWETYAEVLGAHELKAERAGWAWRYMPWVRSASAQFGVDPTLLAALIHTESKWNPYAGSSAGAVGLAQMIPSTAVGRYRKLVERGQWPFEPLTINNDPQAQGYLADKGVEGALDRTDPYQSIWLSAALMRALYDQGFGIETALAAYNAGGAAAKRPRNQWPAETRAYVPGVLNRQQWYEQLEGACGN